MNHYFEQKPSSQLTWESWIQNGAIRLLYVKNHSCGVCDVLREKISLLFVDEPAIEMKEFFVEENPKLAAQYDVFSAPMLLVFVEGKEAFRVGRNVNLSELQEKVFRYICLLD